MCCCMPFFNAYLQGIIGKYCSHRLGPTRTTVSEHKGLQLA
jgi:hypothetical protein